MNYQEFLGKLGRGAVEPIYLFFGEEDFLKEEALKKLMAYLLRPETADLNYQLFYGREVKGGEISEAASTLPFGSEKRLVVVKEADRLPASHKEEIIRYAQAPCSSTCLVLIASKVDRRGRFYSSLTKSGKEVSFKLIYEKDFINWIIFRGRERGKRITPRAAFELVERVGKSLRELDNQLSKLLIYAGDKKEISAEEVRALVGESKEVKTYHLTEAIGEKHRGKALKILSKLLEEERKAPELIGLITYQMRKMARVNARIDRGEAQNEVLESLEIPTFLWRRFIAQIKNFSPEKLRENFYHLLQADLQSKSGRLSPRLVLELLVIKLCG
ncbi:DNA polymerase III subunit delta [candidate division NPL-UPA2 bacterium]|nr:DNA polymerase III subunit delta [candidate division NPL-UPA2 bacterium]